MLYICHLGDQQRLPPGCEKQTMTLSSGIMAAWQALSMSRGTGFKILNRLINRSSSHCKTLISKPYGLIFISLSCLSSDRCFQELSLFRTMFVSYIYQPIVVGMCVCVCVCETEIVDRRVRAWGVDRVSPNCFSWYTHHHIYLEVKIFEQKSFFLKCCFSITVYIQYYFNQFQV